MDQNKYGMEEEDSQNYSEDTALATTLEALQGLTGIRDGSHFLLQGKKQVLKVTRDISNCNSVVNCERPWHQTLTTNHDNFPTGYN